MPRLLSAGQNAGATEDTVKRAQLPFTVLSLGVVAALHELSSVLYAQGWSPQLSTHILRHSTVQAAYYCYLGTPLQVQD